MTEPVLDDQWRPVTDALAKHRLSLLEITVAAQSRSINYLSKGLAAAAVGLFCLAFGLMAQAFR